MHYSEKNSGNFSIRKCYCCDKLITSSFHEVQHNFINHYQKGGEIPIENRAVNKTTDGSIVKFTIDYDSDKNSYDFTNASKILTDGKKELVIKSTFSIRNYQSPPDDLNNVTDLYDLRFWITPVYLGHFFNDFIKTSLKNDVKKRIILNGQTGSSWRFDRFQSISVVFNNNNNQKILRL